MVTSSFDRSSLAVNPAAAATRVHSLVSLSYRLRNSDSEITEERGEETIPWSEEFRSSKYSLLLTGGRKRLVPELYLSFDKGRRSVAGDDGYTNSDNDTDLSLLNNILNLGYKARPWLSLGVKFFMPSYTLKRDERGRGDGWRWRNESTEKTRLLGLGGGTEMHLWRGFHVGGYLLTTKQTSDYNYTNASTDSETYGGSGSSPARSFKKYGAGVGFQRGTSRDRGFRWELSYSAMEPLSQQGSELEADIGRELATAVEIAWRGLTAGINVRWIKGIYHETQELLETKLGDRLLTADYESSYGGFISLNTKRGNSFGLAGAKWRASGERAIFGQQPMPAETETTIILFNYAHLF